MKAFLTLSEAARALRVCDKTVYRWARNSIIPAAKVGRRWRFSEETLTHLVSRKPIRRGVGHVSDHLD